MPKPKSAVAVQPQVRPAQGMPATAQPKKAAQTERAMEFANNLEKASFSLMKLGCAMFLVVPLLLVGIFFLVYLFSPK
jgi:hypothetical protein